MGSLGAGVPGLARSNPHSSWLCSIDLDRTGLISARPRGVGGPQHPRCPCVFWDAFILCLRGWWHAPSAYALHCGCPHRCRGAHRPCVGSVDLGVWGASSSWLLTDHATSSLGSRGVRGLHRLSATRLSLRLLSIPFQIGSKSGRGVDAGQDLGGSLCRGVCLVWAEQADSPALSHYIYLSARC